MAKFRCKGSGFGADTSSKGPWLLIHPSLTHASLANIPCWHDKVDKDRSGLTLPHTRHRHYYLALTQPHASITFDSAIRTFRTRLAPKIGAEQANSIHGWPRKIGLHAGPVRGSSIAPRTLSRSTERCDTRLHLLERAAHDVWKAAAAAGDALRRVLFDLDPSQQLRQHV